MRSNPCLYARLFTTSLKQQSNFHDRGFSKLRLNCLGINDSDYSTSFDSILFFFRQTHLKLEAVSQYDRISGNYICDCNAQKCWVAMTFLHLICPWIILSFTLYRHVQKHCWNSLSAELCSLKPSGLDFSQFDDAIILLGETILLKSVK